MKDVAESLSPIERKILPLIRENIPLRELIERSKLQEVEVIRALQWLENKELIKVRKEEIEIIELDSNGKNALEKGLPEKRFLKAILNNELSLNEIKEKAQLKDDELNVSLGILKRNSCILLGNKIKITESGKKYMHNNKIEEFLGKLPSEKIKLDNYILNELKNRKEMVKENLAKDRISSITNKGKELQKLNIRNDLIESLSVNILRNKSWINKKFRRYNIKINVPKIYPGKKHFVNESLDYARSIWLEMGFKEMKGNIVQSAFWNFDALFTSQDHSVREMQDTFYLKEKENLPNKEIVNRVRAAHENGWNTGSKGWRYKWNEEESKKLVLRTHTTVLSAQTLSRLKKEELPAKFFAIGRNYRNETLDFNHLFEFNQTEGIVVDENANLRNLIGYLKKFFEKMGFERARFRPAYFPYTEPSIEIDVYHPIHKMWIELGGAGMFRPEVVKPLLGKDIPVLAWGPGIDRMITDAYNIKDIRELYRNDLKQLRESKIWLK
jgi:phenylalanyl-tRNA synthetase alpha chain